MLTLENRRNSCLPGPGSTTGGAAPRSGAAARCPAARRSRPGRPGRRGGARAGRSSGPAAASAGGQARAEALGRLAARRRARAAQRSAAHHWAPPAISNRGALLPAPAQRLRSASPTRNKAARAHHDDGDKGVGEKRGPGGPEHDVGVGVLRQKTRRGCGQRAAAGRRGGGLRRGTLMRQACNCPGWRADQLPRPAGNSAVATPPGTAAAAPACHPLLWLGAPGRPRHRAPPCPAPRSAPGAPRAARQNNRS